MIEEGLLRQLAQTHEGSMYLFDVGKLKERVSYLKSHIMQKTNLCYAVKANTFLIGALKNDVERFEACSPGEARICMQSGVTFEKMVISGVYKTPSFIKEWMFESGGAGIYTAESKKQVKLLAKIAEEQKKRVKVLLRLTSGNQFGMDKPQLFEIIKERYAYPQLDFIGIQYFSGTQKQSVKRLKRELDGLCDIAKALWQEENFFTRELEFGPGFPFCYFGEEFDEEGFLDEFAKILQQTRERLSCECKGDVQLTLELGRSIAASCGTYLTRVVDVKENKGQHYAIIDGGIHQIAYYGQMMAMKQPVLHVIGNSKENESELCEKDDTLWNICGSLCTGNDILAKQMLLPSLKEGTLLAFSNAGAYCVTEGISLFLSRSLPHVFLICEDGTVLHVRDEVQTQNLNSANLHLDR